MSPLYTAPRLQSGRFSLYRRHTCKRALPALLTKQSQNSTLRRLLCPLSVQRTACPCVRSLSRMAAVAALLALPTIPASARTTPKKKPAPAPHKNSAKTWPSTALGRLIPAVVRGDVKPKTARTVAYLAQTLLQAIHISQDEYCEAFDTDDWRKSIRNSVNENHAYRFRPAPQPQQSESPQPQPQPVAPAVNCHSERSEESASSSNSSLATHLSPLPQAPQPAPPPHTSLPPTSAEFVQRVVAGLQTGGGQAPQPASTPPSPRTPQPTAVAHPSRGEALRPASPSLPSARPNPSPKVASRQPVEMPPSCHSERSEESAFSSFRPISNFSPRTNTRLLPHALFPRLSC